MRLTLRGGGANRLLATCADINPENSQISSNKINAKKSYKELFTSKKCAFTLAEVLITLAIIGVVSAITIPVLVQNVQSKVKKERIKNIYQKLSKGTDRMAVQSSLTGYESTKDFIVELSKHYKISQICDNNNLQACWPVSEVKLKEDGKTWEIAKTKTAKTLKIQTDNWLDTVGIVTGDGVSMILSYDKNCDFNADFNSIKMDKDTGKSSSLECISGIFDWNGGRSPNKLGEDIQLLGDAKGLGQSCAFELGGTCYGAVFEPKPVTKAECEAMKTTHGIKECFYDNDYWAGAVKQCGHVDKLPTPDQLQEIADYIYKDVPKVSWSAGIEIYDTAMLTERTASLGLPEITLGSYFYLWSGEEYLSSHAMFHNFDIRRSFSGGYGRNGSYAHAVCLGD